MSPKVPALVLALAGKVNMTPIAWKIDPTSVTIVFEQGPKLHFDRLPTKDPGKPVFMAQDDVAGHIKIADLAPFLSQSQDIVPQAKVAARKKSVKSGSRSIHS